MKIAFYDKGGRLLSETNGLAAIAILAACGTAIKFLVFDFNGACSFLPGLEHCPDKTYWEVIGISLLSSFAIATFVVAMYKVALALGYGLSLPFRTLFLVSRITQKKLHDEFRSFPNKSIDLFEKEIEGARNDERDIVEAQEIGVIKNDHLWLHKWSEKSGRYGELTQINVSSKDRKDRFDNAITRLKICIEDHKSNPQEHVSFFVSSVQPSILYCLQAILKACKQSDGLNIEDKMPTGPRNVAEAYSKHNDINNKMTVLFAAPLSAFMTFNASQSGKDINKQFRPVGCLVKENQDILIVHGKQTNLVRKGTLFVYNNSTAEECLSRLPLEMIAPSGSLNVKLVDDFDAYKTLLKGRTNQYGDKLRNGDAIVTWSPLTEYYLHRQINDCHFEFLDHEDFRENRASRIMLYAPNSLFINAEKHELSWALIEALTYRFLLADDGGWLRLKRWMFWTHTSRFLINYEARYKDIVK